jgi:hypothetical protein
MNMNFRLTKKDCIVVFICAVFLLTALGAAGAGSRERARRMVCKANLYQWFIAYQGYADDNNDTLMISTGYGFSGNKLTSIFPNEMNFDSYATSKGTGYGIDDLANQGFPEPYSVISHETLWPYLKGFNDQNRRRDDIMVDGIVDSTSPGAEDLRLRNAWSCPSHNLNNLDDTIERLRERSYFRLQYAYFGRVEFWDNLATDPEDITANILTSSKLLMADSIFYWYPSDIWIYNHGKFGASDHHLSQILFQPIDAMTGINKLLGDGSVNWKNAFEFDNNLFTSPLGAEPRINNGFGAYMYY